MRLECKGQGIRASAAVRLPNGMGPGPRGQIARRGRGRVRAFEQVCRRINQQWLYVEAGAAARDAAAGARSDAAAAGGAAS